MLIVVYIFTKTNERNLLDKHTPVSNIDATTQLLSNFQLIRVDDIPMKLTTTSNNIVRETVQDELKSIEGKRELYREKFN